MKQWGGVGEAYSASYAALCAGTFAVMRNALGDAGGRTLLDVGSGDGTLAAAWAASGWSVTACEPEATMRTVSRRNHPEVRVVDGGLPDLAFADKSSDVVVANFVLNHVDDPRESAAELRRVSRDAVVATTWTLSPSWFWAEIVERAGITPQVGTQLPAAKDFERTTQGFGQMLTEAGLDGVVVTERQWVWEATAAALWTSAEGGVAGAGALYGALDSVERKTFRVAFEAVVEERSQGGLIPLEHRAAIAVSTFA